MTGKCQAVVIAHTFVSMPFFVISVEGALRASGERYDVVAATLGADRWTTFRRVTLPLALPGLLAGSVLAWARSLGEFGATSFLARDDNPTLPVVIYRLIGHPGEMNYGMALAASVVLAAATACVMLAVERLRVPSVGAF